MRKINNKGYTLVTVLLIITIFTVLFVSFAGLYSNRAKQNKTLEKESQSVALAEMGVTYFDQTVQNIYISNKDSIQQNVKNLYQSDKQAGRLQSKDYYIQKAIQLMTEKFDSLNPITIAINDKPGATFTIKIPPNQTNIIRTVGDDILIDFISLGNENGQNTEIRTTITMDFGELLTTSGTGGTGGGSTPILAGNTITDPGNLEACNNNGKKIDFTNTNCQINGSTLYDNNDNVIFSHSIFKVKGGLTLPNMNKDINDSTLFIQNTLTTGNLNSLDNLKLHVGGIATIGHFNGNGLTDSVVEFATTSSMGNIKLTRSSMYIGGIATIGNINNMEDSVLYIDSLATIGVVNIGKNSTICVNGLLTVGNINNNSNGTSKIYAKASINPNVITDGTAYKNACSRNNTPTVTWGFPTIDAQYDYQY